MKEPILLFDCFGLFYSEAFVRFFVERYGAEEGVRLKDKYCRPADLGGADFEETIAKMSKDLGRNPESLKEEILGYCHKNEEMFALLSRCRKRHKAYLLSNCMRGWFEALGEERGLVSYFDGVFLSCDLGMAKPDDDIFQYVKKTLGEDRRYYFFDDGKPNVDGARRNGIEAFLFQDAKTCEEELVRLGLL